MKIIRLSPLLLLIALAVLVIAPTGAQAISCQTLFGQAGTAADPMRVASADQLALVRSCAAGGFVFQQTQDIDLAGVTWSPIGTADFPFNGTYDGGGHRITGLSIPVITLSYTGFFGYAQHAVIRKLSIVGAAFGDGNPGYSYSHIGVLAGQILSSEISDAHVVDAELALSRDDSDVAALVGSANSSTITASSASGTVVAGAPAGGLVGDACSSSISSSTSSVAVQAATGNGTGGLVGAVLVECRGFTSVGTEVTPAGVLITAGVFDSQATGSVRGVYQVGGLVGFAEGVPIERSFATGSVEALSTAGGLLGFGQDLMADGSFGAADAAVTTRVVDSYARGAVSGQTEVGGLVGTAPNAQLLRSYATGRVSGISALGGLLASELVPVAIVAAESFWDTATTEQATSVLGVGKTTAEMKSLSTFASAGWAIAQGWVADTTKTWGVCAAANGGYPYLLREYTTATEPCTTVTGAPTSPKAVAGDGSVVVSWGAPMADGGASATSYTATAQMQARAAKSCTATAPALTCTIAGLANGRAYTVSIVAINRKGAGVAAVTGKVTPRSSLVVVSARRSALAVASRVRVSGAGRLVQVGTVVGSQQAACRVTASAKAAGTVALRCALNRTASAALATRSLRVRLVTTFRSANGTAQSTTRIVRFARLDPAPVVTG